jgi:hypothetical protein
MTNREFYTAIINANVSAEITEYAESAIAKLDATNEKRKAKAAEGASKKAEENAPIKAAILAALTAEPQTSPAIGAIVGVSHNKVTPLVKQLVAEGLAEVTEIKVPGRGVMKAYSTVASDAE